MGTLPILGEAGTESSLQFRNNEGRYPVRPGGSCYEGGQTDMPQTGYGRSLLRQETVRCNPPLSDKAKKKSNCKAIVSII